MSEAILLQNTVNKPGTSCLGCRRRKLKCSRESEGCLNCTKSDLPCVYPTPEVGVKRKRGPYKKDKPPRQRHLEDLVKYLEPKSNAQDGARNGDSASPGQGSSSSHSGYGRPSLSAEARPLAQTANSEDLVKDALIALTKSSVSDHDNKYDDGAWPQNYNTSGPQSAVGTRHPPVRRIFEYWHLFVTRVDPMTKLIHCPTFARKLFSAIDNFSNVSSSTEALMFAVYYAALSTCTAREARRRFGEGQDVLMHRYGRSVEAALGENYDIPQLEALQALVLYIICIRRAGDGTNIRALFSLAVRSAQMIGLHEDPEGTYSPFEVEMRRRLWFHLCGLESRTAEEGGSRNTTILKDRNVQLPANLNDNDLDPRMTHPPQTRVGVADMTFPILRFEIHRLVFGLWGIRKERNGNWAGQESSGQYSVRDHQNDYYEQAKARLDTNYMQYMHTSRAYDWLCTNFVESMLIKARLIIDFPFGTTPTKDMPKEERMTLLQASVDIIQKTHGVANDERIADYNWYFRGYVQWHSLAIVVAELGWSTNLDFANNAWAVLDPILADWDRMYKTKRDEPAWQHVHTLIERARHIRLQRRQQLAAQKQSSHKRTRTDISVPALQETPRYSPNVVQVHQSMPPEQAPGSHTPSHQAMAAGPYNYTQSEPPASYSAGTPASHHGSSFSGPCTGTGLVMDFNLDFDPFAGMENVDFNAFNEVFNDGSWEMMDNLEDVNIQIHDETTCGNWWGLNAPVPQANAGAYHYQAPTHG
ncbi:Bikaverin cluster transcription factor bik5 [Pseudocercospora fuligena]|uniref:Bikaverin cluster transcription factor bik5 n=1 Tax=Pseudocercospora fuligena TaxID=685502 RepID=A0A8H6RH49_9PEZI|nr:Bikaverin cluster transcription factor bik5 [Pseudocercospora fuligena]